MLGNKRVVIVAGLLVALLVAATMVVAAGETMSRFAILGGGGAGSMASSGDTLRGSFGQAVAGKVVSDHYVLCSGYYCGSAESGGSHNDVYLPLVLSGFSASGVISIEEAPDACPGTAIQVGRRYGEDLDHSNDNDWFEFQAAGGRAYTLRTFDLESRADTVMYLYGLDCGTLLAENDDVAPGNGASQIVWTAPASGVYHIDVRGYNYTVFGSDTGYKLEVVEGVPDAIDASPAADKPPALPTPEAHR
jgi:hypothetical protein